MALLRTKRWEGWCCCQVIGAISKLRPHFLEQRNRISLSILGCASIECGLISIVWFWILLGIKCTDNFLLPFVKCFQIIKAMMEVIKSLLQSLYAVSIFPLPMISSVYQIYIKWQFPATSHSRERQNCIWLLKALDGMQNLVIICYTQQWLLLMLSNLSLIWDNV